MTWTRAAAIGLGLAVLAIITSRIPDPWDDIISAFTRYAILVTVIYEVWINRYERKQDRAFLVSHRDEIKGTLNHRLLDLTSVKKTAEELERRQQDLAEQLAERQREIAERLARETKAAAEKAAEESQKRHEKLDERLTEVIAGQKTLIQNGHDTKPVMDDTNIVAHQIADTVGVDGADGGDKEKP